MKKLRKVLWWFFIVIGVLVTIGMIYQGIFGKKSGGSSSRSSSNDNICMDTDTGKEFYRMGVRSGNEDRDVIRDCEDYWNDFVRPQLNSSEGNGIVTIGCFCSGYNSVSKSY